MISTRSYLSYVNPLDSNQEFNELLSYPADDMIVYGGIEVRRYSNRIVVCADQHMIMMYRQTISMHSLLNDRMAYRFMFTNSTNAQMIRKITAEFVKHFGCVWFIKVPHLNFLISTDAVVTESNNIVVLSAPDVLQTFSVESC